MGADAGFDMVPRLSQDPRDQYNWAQFIQAVKMYYGDDPKVQIKQNYIEFTAGEHPRLPFEGHKFLRFSSKITGGIAQSTKVESYISVVTRLAKHCFGSRIRYWDELRDDYGHYDWNEVYASINSFFKPHAPEVPADAEHIAQVDSPLFEVRDIPGKGRGLVARCDIPEGTRILCEKPFFTVTHTTPDKLQLIAAVKLKQLSKEEQRQFLSLHNHFPGKFALAGIVRTNALPCGSGSPVGGVYPTICLINHSCLNNSHNNWNPDAKHETIHAIRHIRAGEEITIPYDYLLPSAARRDHFKDAFGFECTCRVCSLSPSEVRASDDRRLRIKQLDEDIGNPMRMACAPLDSLKDCHTLLRLLREELDGHAGALEARLYYDAFQICISHGDEARAGVFAERTYVARKNSEGEDSAMTQKAKSLALRPSSHPSFALLSKKWASKKSMVPKGLDSAGTEKWLFRV